jgi:hypothetical protein
MIQRKQIESLLEGTTPGPWRVEKMDCGDYTGEGISPEVTGELLGASRRNARLMAAAPALARACLDLLEVNERLRQEIGTLRRSI